MPALYTRLEGYRHYLLDWKGTALYTRLEGYRHYILDWKGTDTMYETGLSVKALHTRLAWVLRHYILDWKDTGTTY